MNLSSICRDNIHSFHSHSVGVTLKFMGGAGAASKNLGWSGGVVGFKIFQAFSEWPFSNSSLAKSSFQHGFVCLSFPHPTLLMVEYSIGNSIYFSLWSILTYWIDCYQKVLDSMSMKSRQICWSIYIRTYSHTYLHLKIFGHKQPRLVTYATWTCVLWSLVAS